MQHNLLPKEKKKDLRMEYLVRVGNVTALFLTVATVLGAAALVPAYIKVSAELSDVSVLKDKETDEQEIEEYTKAETALTETAQELGALRKKIFEKPVTDTITNVVSARPVGIAISGISFERASGAFIVEGVAVTRTALVSYRRALEEREGIENVTSPIANLAKNANLPFQLSFVVQSATSTTNE